MKRRYIETRHGMTAAGHVNAVREAGIKGMGWVWKIRPVFFYTEDGRLAVMTRDAVDRKLPHAAGIVIIDGDIPDPEQLRDVETAGSA